MIRLFPKPKKVEEHGGEYFFGKTSIISIPKNFFNKAQIKLFCELFKNFTAGIGKLRVEQREDDQLCVTVSEKVLNPIVCNLEDNDYILNVSNDGAYLYFSSTASFARAFSTMLSVLEVRSTTKNNESFTLPICKIEDKPEIDFRSIHFCVFAETEFRMLKKFIRFSCFAKYSHIIVEFWGTYPYKCVKEMSRAKYAYKTSQIKQLIKECNCFGVELIPMLNVLGHAAQNRALFGKHTALDQNPALSDLYEPDGWTWNILNPKTVKVVHEMIDELCDVFVDSKYFHIGCDESFPYGSSRLFEGKDKTDVMIDYVNNIQAKLKKRGKTAIMWGDQLLYNPEWPTTVYAYGESKESTDKLLAKLDKDIIIADWQYEAQMDVIPSAKVLSDAGFRVIMAPWGGSKRNCAKNVLEQNYFGYMQTTWDDMNSTIRIMLEGADQSWRGGVVYEKIDSEFMAFETISYMRRLSPPKGDYEYSGIRKHEIIV